MRVVGLDLSLTSSGVAVIQGDARRSYYAARVKSNGSRSATLMDRYRRVRDLRLDICSYIVGADLVVVEAPAFSRNNAGTWDRAGLWWSVVRTVLGSDTDLIEVPPTTRAKYATGRGNAGKDEVLAAVIRRYDHLSLAEITGNDEADALVLAAIGARLLGKPIEESLPKANLEALERIEVPW